MKAVLIILGVLAAVVLAGAGQDYATSLNRCHKYDASSEYWGYECKSGTVYVKK